MIKAVIFDMDGVISDSLSLHTHTESKVLARYDIYLTPEEILKRFNAVPDPVMYKQLFDEIGKKPNLEKLAEEKLVLFKEMAKKELRAIPGSIDFINDLSNKSFLLAVASSAPADIVNLILTTLHIKNKFGAIVTPEQVKHGKPDPECFLLAAKKLSTIPENCVVVEDAPRGITAAKKAGMQCIGITTTHPKSHLHEADKIIDSFKQINPDIIRLL